jgi:hypothetical protein
VKLFRNLAIMFGVLTLLVVSFFSLPMWGTTETKFICKGIFAPQRDGQKEVAEASFIFERYARFLFWEEVGTIHFELHEPAYHTIFYVYKTTDYTFKLTEIGKRQAVLGHWSMISNGFVAKLSGDSVFDGSCKASV